MALTKTFYNAVASNDVLGIRIMMEDSLLVELSFKEYETMVETARNVNGLYDKHDGKELNQDKSTWNDDYMNKLKVEVVDNFSHERLEHLKQVIRHLYPYTPPKSCANEKVSKQKGSKYQEQKQRDQQVGNYRPVKIVVGAVAGSVVAGGIAATTTLPVMVTVAAGAVAGAAVSYVLTEERK